MEEASEVNTVGCKWNAASSVTWSIYSTKGATHSCSAPRCLL